MRKRRKDAGHPECNPPPVAPRFATGFAKILGLIESDVFLHCVSLVLRRADDLKARCFSENQVRLRSRSIGHVHSLHVPPEFFQSTKLYNQPKLQHTWLGQY